jgi:hypothetical protein
MPTAHLHSVAFCADDAVQIMRRAGTRPVTRLFTSPPLISTQPLFSGADLKPYAPVHVAASADGSDNIILTWVRRSRIGGDLHDATGSVPLGETSEAYSVDILSGPGGSVKRTIDVTAPTATYENADVLTDFGSVPASITVRVYQISGVIGRGFTRETTVMVT